MENLGAANDTSRDRINGPPHPFLTLQSPDPSPGRRMCARPCERILEIETEMSGTTKVLIEGRKPREEQR
jgi:hypothetical protein